jgi:Zn-finger nucleic acid-binding protein
MNSTIVAQLAPSFVVSPLIPAKQLYWQGYDMYCECAITGNWLDAGELAAMTPEEKRGYEAAGRHQADTETYCYLANTNAYGDRTDGGW